METEIWKEIPGFPFYEISSLGRVKTTRRQGSQGGVIESTVSYAARGSSYKRRVINLYRGDGKRYHRKVHLLVLLAFRGNKPLGTEASHLNGNGCDNRLSNLVWESHTKNIKRKREHGTELSGPDHPRSCARLTPQDVKNIHTLRQKGWPQLRIAIKFGVNACHISRILSGEAWPHLHPLRRHT